MNRSITRRALLAVGLTGLISLATEASPSTAATTILNNGIDVSWLPGFEAAGGKFFTTANKPIDAFELMRVSGIKVIRVRVFVNPSERNGRLDDALSLATRAKASGIDFCLDFHFSDTWADPSNQQIPAAWSKTNLTLLSTQLKQYVIDTLNQFKTRNLNVAYVQLGNEIAGGMLWPLGKLNGNNAAAWTSFTTLYNSALAGLKTVYPNAKNVLHLELGGDANTLRWWLPLAQSYGLVGYDIVGLSYYSQWQGDLDHLNAALTYVSKDRNKPVLIAETAYPNSIFSFGNDVISGVLPAFDPSPSGQASYIRKLQTMLKALKNNNGVGIWWWEGMVPHVVEYGHAIWDKGMTNSSLLTPEGKATVALAALKS